MQPSAYRGIEGVTKEAAIPRMPLTYDWSNGPGEFARPCTLRTESNRGPAPGRGADRALQLPVRPSPRWAVPAADRGHRPYPIQARQPGADRRGPPLAGHELGRDPARPVGTKGHLREGGRRLDRQRRCLSLLLYPAAA